MAGTTITKDFFWGQPLSQNEKIAHDMGFRFIGGNLIGPDGKIRTPTISVRGYKQFSIRVDGKKKIVKLHRFVAYLKYGDEIYNHQCVRHMDGDPLNNAFGNIILGSQHDNLMDIDPVVRSRKATNAITTRWMRNCMVA